MEMEKFWLRLRFFEKNSSLVKLTGLKSFCAVVWICRFVCCEDIAKYRKHGSLEEYKQLVLDKGVRIKRHPDMMQTLETYSTCDISCKIFLYTKALCNRTQLCYFTLSILYHFKMLFYLQINCSSADLHQSVCNSVPTLI